MLRKLGLIFQCAAVLWLTGCRVLSDHSSLSVQNISFSRLPGWQKDADLSDAFSAFKKSCPFLLRLPYSKQIGLGMKAGDWHPVCRKALKIACLSNAEARKFFEGNFRPQKVKNRSSTLGVFTGYYESSLQGSRKKTARYAYPIYAPPKDLICLKNSARCGHKGLFGLKPHYERSEITHGALSGKGLEIVWVDDPLEVFSLHIQGSGRVSLEDGSVMRLKYAGNNGHKFIPIGRILLEEGKISSKNMSMQSIRRWVAENPKKADALMDKNPRYIFFNSYNGPGPIGCIGVPLTPRRSLAVDRAYMPMGVPLWLNTDFPGNHYKMQRLFISQDTGAAIKGPVRGDIFWGHGTAAREKAGKTKEKGEYYVLIPL